MTRTLGTLREFETANFRVIVDAIEEDSLDLSWDDDGSVAEGLDSGRLIAFTARARVLTLSGIELASDYLGNCIYKDFDDFMDHRACGAQNREYEARGESGRCGSYFSDMISTVCREARLELPRLKDRIASVSLRTVKV